MDELVAVPPVRLAPGDEVDRDGRRIRIRDITTRRDAAREKRYRLHYGDGSEDWFEVRARGRVHRYTTGGA